MSDAATPLTILIGSLVHTITSMTPDGPWLLTHCGESEDHVILPLEARIPTCVQCLSLYNITAPYGRSVTITLEHARKVMSGQKWFDDE